LTSSRENLDRAHAQFRETVKASGAGKSYTAQFELQADAVRAKTARLKALRLAREAVDAEAAKRKATPQKRKPMEIRHAQQTTARRQRDR
jgi:hypothetical protein